MEILVCKTESPDVKASTMTETDEEAAISCRACLHEVTHPIWRVVRNENHCHTFANPYGHVFEIGCFSKADGCVKASGVSDDFSWFKGYVWSVGVCRKCSAQLGWIFTCPSDTFYALIIDQLIFP